MALSGHLSVMRLTPLTRFVRTDAGLLITITDIVPGTRVPRDPCPAESLESDLGFVAECVATN